MSQLAAGHCLRKDAVLPLVFLSLYAAARSLGAGANDVYKALGRPGISIGISLVRLAILVPALLHASQWGIVGVACAQLVVAVLFALVRIWRRARRTRRRSAAAPVG
jgi:Na+-driven multidrug efflux pump